MRCLTDSECTDWIKVQGMVVSPYGDSEGCPVMKAGHYHQFGIQNSAFLAERLVALASPFEQGLLWIIDDGWDITPIDALIDALRRSHGESRPSGLVTGYLYDAAEGDEMAGLFFLTIEHGMSAYLYMAGSDATFFNWEGTLIDAWTNDPNQTQEVQMIVDRWLQHNPGKS